MQNVDNATEESVREAHRRVDEMRGFEMLDTPAAGTAVGIRTTRAWPCGAVLESIPVLRMPTIDLPLLPPDVRKLVVRWPSPGAQDPEKQWGLAAGFYYYYRVAPDGADTANVRYEPHHDTDTLDVVTTRGLLLPCCCLCLLEVVCHVGTNGAFVLPPQSFLPAKRCWCPSSLSTRTWTLDTSDTTHSSSRTLQRHQQQNNKKQQSRQQSMEARRRGQQKKRKEKEKSSTTKQTTTKNKNKKFCRRQRSEGAKERVGTAAVHTPACWRRVTASHGRREGILVRQQHARDPLQCDAVAVAVARALLAAAQPAVAVRPPAARRPQHAHTGRPHPPQRVGVDGRVVHARERRAPVRAQPRGAGLLLAARAPLPQELRAPHKQRAAHRGPAAHHTVPAHRRRRGPCVCHQAGRRRQQPCGGVCGRCCCCCACCCGRSERASDHCTHRTGCCCAQDAGKLAALVRFPRGQAGVGVAGDVHLHVDLPVRLRRGAVPRGAHLHRPARYGAAADAPELPPPLGRSHGRCLEDLR